MKRLMVCLGSAMLMASVGCGGGSGSDDSNLDSNGVFDMTEADVFQLLGAIQSQCAAEGSGGGFSAATEAECRAACDCGIRAVDGLENKTQSPELTAACYNSCSDDFQGTDEQDVNDIIDDANDEPEYDRFFLAYIAKCDHVANRQIQEDRDFAAECIDTCNCLADTMEQYINESADDNVRAGCDSQCNGTAQRSSTSSPGNSMSLFLHGGLGAGLGM